LDKEKKVFILRISILGLAMLLTMFCMIGLTVAYWQTLALTQ